MYLAIEVGDRDGLLIEVHPSGRMTWRYRYRLAGSREKVTLGTYPATGLKAARDRAREAQRLVEAGQSPARVARLQAARIKADADAVETVADLAERWVAEVLKPANKRADQRVVASHRPDTELAQVDWARVDAIVAGIRRLEEHDTTELRDDLAADLRDHNQRLVDLRAAGLGKLADRLEADPRLQRALKQMREFTAQARTA
ncbi:TPA: DUF4102 domain-containing protein [Stenotrophomonas maltophilia]|nr:DUF4102 domain-containing protein [Stenotrophomonas maltophilia]